MHKHQGASAGNGLLTVEVAARKLSISTRTLRSLIADGRIPVVRVSPGRIAISEQDLIDYIRDRRTSAR